MNEFEFIAAYLQKNPSGAALDRELLLGIGDDAATLKVKDSSCWHISTDMLLTDKHFFNFDPPAAIAHKALAVNFSDMAAMGAVPRWLLLAIALPELKTSWLDDFFASFFKVLAAAEVTLIGGDTTKGDLTLSITVIGESKNHPGLRRGGAVAGDEIWVTGSIGSAAAALQHHWGKIVLTAEEFARCEQARLYPCWRFRFMTAAASLIHAAADISDGLMQDLGHILTASGVGAVINRELIPSLITLLRFGDRAWDWIVNGGDDYELVFTAPKANRTALQKLAEQYKLPLTVIGVITAGGGCVLSADGQPVENITQGFDHFV